MKTQDRSHKETYKDPTTEASSHLECNKGQTQGGARTPAQL